MQFRILVTSSKGGVGKSTTSLLLALSLAKRGKRVLLCDCDIGSRCLDMLLGIEDEVVYDIGDVYGGNVSAERAIIRPDGRGGLMFCAASLSLSVSEMKAEKLCGALDALAEASDADFVICDTAGSAIPDMIAGGFANLALVCTTQQPASVRSAEATAIRLRGLLRGAYKRKVGKAPGDHIRYSTARRIAYDEIRIGCLRKSVERAAQLFRLHFRHGKRERRRAEHKSAAPVGSDDRAFGGDIPAVHVADVVNDLVLYAEEHVEASRTDIAVTQKDALPPLCKTQRKKQRSR